MRKSRVMSIGCAVAVCAAAGVLATRQVDAQQPQGMGEMLTRGLMATPGCLGVQVAQSPGGRNTIFAWFEDKEAVQRWYHSETHQRMMGGAMAGVEPNPPLQHVADGTGPIMVIASLQMADRPMIEGVALPISGISIELYQPLPGGAYIKSRFTPEGVAMPMMRSLGGE